jgi:hypothetical protein
MDELCFKLEGEYLMGTQVGDLTTIDSDGDGFRDIVAATDAGLHVLVNDGSGALTPTPYDVERGYVAAAAGDVVGGPAEDIVALRLINEMPGFAELVTLENTDGAFAEATSMMIETGAGLALTDVDGDGELDVVVARDAEGLLALYVGDGAGAFTPATTVASGTAPVQVIASAVDGDAVPDLTVVNYGSNSLGVSRVVADDLSEVDTYALGGAPRGVAAASLAGGSRDLLVITEGADELAVLTADGAGDLDEAAVYELGDAPRAVVAADFNGDGADVAVALRGLGAVGFWLNDGGTLAPYTTYAVISDPSALVAVRINDDSRPDVAVASDGVEGGVRVLLSDLGD